MERNKPAAPFRIRDVLGLDFPTVEILDVGAMIEGEDCYAPLVDQGLARVTGFEPDPAEYDRLCAEKKDFHTWLPYFLGDGEPATFHVARYPGCSSLYHADSGIIDLFTAIGASPPDGNFYVKHTEKVTTRRLDDVEECPSVDFLKIDVQGAELDILRHGTDTLGDVLVLQTETEFVPLYEGQPLFGDIQVFLRDQGFLFHKFIDVCGRAFRPFRFQNPYKAFSQVLWADAIFVRDFTALDRLSDEQLLKSALILNDMYCSYDLVHLILADYDRRQETALAGKFSIAISASSSLPLKYMNLKESV